MRNILICLILLSGCVTVPEPRAVTPTRYGRIICAGYSFKTDKDKAIMRLIFRTFHENVEMYAQQTDFRTAWLQDTGGKHQSFINLYYKKLNEETGYSAKSADKRLVILKSFQNGLTCDELSNKRT